MKKKRNLIIIIGLILTAGVIFYLLKTEFLKSPAKSKPQASAQTSAPAHQGHTAENKEPQAWVETQQKEQTEEAPTVEIPPEKQQLIGVKTVEVSVKPIQKIIRTVGRIEYDERKLATVNTKFEGWIEKLYADYTGKYVKKGEPLAEIYSPELFATQQEFVNLLKWANRKNNSPSPPFSKGGKGGLPDESISAMLSKDAEAIIEAAKQRLRLWDITDEQIKKIEETGKPIRTLTIYSPVSGYVTQKMALQGIRVMPGERLFDIADLSSVWVISDIYEYELPLIKPGQRVSMSLSYFPGKEFSSTIDYIYPSLAGETRTAKVRFTIANPGGQLKPQMFTNVEVKINLGNKLVIPESAVIDTGIRQIVYVDKGEGYFEPREVMIGLKAEGMVEVLKGIKAGEKVASSGNFLIDSEAQLKGIKPLGHKHL